MGNEVQSGPEVLGGLALQVVGHLLFSVPPANGQGTTPLTEQQELPDLLLSSVFPVPTHQSNVG